MAPTPHRQQRRIGEHARDRRELRDFIGRRTVEQPVGFRQHGERRTASSAGV